MIKIKFCPFCGSDKLERFTYLAIHLKCKSCKRTFRVFSMRKNTYKNNKKKYLERISNGDKWI